jgi:hypothetical protein
MKHHLFDQTELETVATILYIMRGKVLTAVLIMTLAQRDLGLPH